MRKKLNSTLLKNLLETEFLMLSSKSKKNASKFEVGVSLSALESTNTLSLDVFELVKTLKQLVRALQFLNKQKNKRLTICLPVKNTFSFLELYQKESLLSSLVKLESDLGRVKKYNKGVHSLMLLEEALRNKNSTFNKLIEQDVLIVNKVNSFKELNHNGTYKVYNDVFDFKKLAFLTSLINNVLKKLKHQNI